MLALLGASSLIASAPAAGTALPGTINYVEGQVSIDGRALAAKQDGNTEVQANQTLSTGNGKAEMLLSPGIFVRAGDNSEIRMISPELVDPTIEVVRGEVMVEVDQKPKDAQVDVLEHGATATILKQGLYDFDSDRSKIEVMDGKVNVKDNGHSKEVGKGKEIVLNGEPLKTVSFDRKAEDSLYRWSNVRSEYLAQANAATAQNIYLGYGPFRGAGWYWNPWFTSWSWLPGDGYFYSPFGYPFFSPGFVVYAPYYRTGGFGGGFRGGVPGGRRVFVPAPQTGTGFRAGGGRAGGGGAGGGLHGGIGGDSQRAKGNRRSMINSPSASRSPDR
jgi:hypothetical protein